MSEPVVLCCGSRHWDNIEIIRQAFAEWNPGTVIHGGARGADALCDQVATERECFRWVFHADWGRWKRKAGPIRNREMLTRGKPDVVLAFHDDWMASRGTRDMMLIADEAGIPVALYMTKGYQGIWPWKRIWTGEGDTTERAIAAQP